MSKVQVLLEDWKDTLMRIPGVTGVGRGGNHIIIYVERVSTEILRAIPLTLEGVRVEVKSSGKIRLLSLMQIPALQARTAKWPPPIPGGVSISCPQVTAGTLACRILDARTGQVLGLSNNHVLLGSDWGEQKGYVSNPVYQPGCYSEDMRVLTSEGFKHFYELTYEDKVATLDGDGEIEYQKPTIIHAYPYKGRMIHFNGQMYDLLVTPNHRMFVRKCWKDDFEFMEAEDLLRYTPSSLSQIIELKRNAKWNCEGKDTFVPPQVEGQNTKQVDSIPMNLWLEFFGWWISEGSIYFGQKGNYKVLIRQIDGETLTEIAEVVHKMGFNPYIHKNHSVEFCSKQLYSFLKTFGHAGDKFIPSEIKDLPPEKLMILMRNLFRGDGSFVSIDEDVKPENVGKPRRYFTISSRLADDVAEIALKCGYGVSISFRDKMFVVGISYRNLTPRITVKPKVLDYDGFVYCVTVPNHIIFVERNGKTAWCGNSYDGGSIEDAIGYAVRGIPVRLDTENLVDACVFSELEPNILSREVLDLGVPGSAMEPVIGLQCMKSGRTTGTDQSIIESVGGTVDVAGWGTCLPGETQVITHEGPKEIRDVKVGDEVLTHEGRFKKVLTVHKRKYAGKLIEIKPFMLSNSIRLTSEHPVYGFLHPKRKQANWVRKYWWEKQQPRWIEADNIRKGDCVVFPTLKLQVEDPLIFDLKFLNETLLCDEEVVWYKSGFSSKTGKQAKCKRFIQVDSDLARVIGYYIADGASEECRLSFSDGNKENLEWAIKIIEEKTGVHGSLRKKRGSYEGSTDSWEARISSKILSIFFRKLCGKYPINKRMPKELLFGPTDLLASLVKGIIMGDGYEINSRVGRYEVTTISKGLASDLILALIKLGKKPGVHYRDGKYVISTINPSSGDANKSWLLAEGAYAMLVRDVKQADFDGFVYNLEVEDDQSYVTESFAVHNCRFTDQIIFRPSFAQGGDSGSLVVDLASGRVIGIVFAGSDEVTAVCKASNIESLLGVTFGPAEVGVPVARRVGLQYPFILGMGLVMMGMLKS